MTRVKRRWAAKAAKVNSNRNKFCGKNYEPNEKRAGEMFSKAFNMIVKSHKEVGRIKGEHNSGNYSKSDGETHLKLLDYGFAPSSNYLDTEQVVESFFWR